MSHASINYCTHTYCGTHARTVALSHSYSYTLLTSCIVLYSIYIMSYAKRFIWRENRPLTRTGPRRTVAPISTALQIITRHPPGVYVIITRRLPSHTALHRRPGFKIITCDRTRTEPGASPDRGGPDVALNGSASGPLRFRPGPAPVHRQVNRSVRSRQIKAGRQRRGRGEARRTARPARHTPSPTLSRTLHWFINLLLISLSPI